MVTVTIDSKTDTSVKRTPRVGPCPVLLSLRRVTERWRYSLEFFVVCAARLFKSWPYFRPKMSFSCFQTRPLKSISVFRPGIMSSLLRLERKQKDFIKSIFEFALLLSFSYSFGVEKPNMFIHSRSSFENYTRFQTKMGTASTRFRTETGQGPNLLGLHIPIRFK